MKALIALIALLPLSAFALNIGDCHSSTQLDSKLAQEGQSTLVVAKDWDSTPNSEVRVTLSGDNAGYFFRGTPGRLCVVAKLEAINAPEARSRAPFDLCQQKSLNICDKVNAGFKPAPLTTTISAVTSTVLIGKKIGAGRTVTEFGFCKKSSANPLILCAISQTAAAVKKN